MAYAVSLLSEKDGFDGKIAFESSLDENGLSALYDEYVKGCTGVQKEHLPRRCPIRKSAGGGNAYELSFNDHNLRYNFDALMSFLGKVLAKGTVKSAKILDGGRISGTAFVVTPGLSKRFSYFATTEILSRLSKGDVAYADIMVDEDKVPLCEYLKTIGS